MSSSGESHAKARIRRPESAACPGRGEPRPPMSEVQLQPREPRVRAKSVKAVAPSGTDGDLHRSRSDRKEANVPATRNGAALEKRNE
jgi:hypothetical protein